MGTKFSGASKSLQKVDLMQDIHMVDIEVPLFHAVDHDLIGKGRVQRLDAGLLQLKVGVLIMHVGGEMSDLNV